MTLNERFLSLEARLTKAMGHATRLKILHLIAENGPRCVCELVPVLRVDQSNVSQHLSVLRQAGVVVARRDGARVVYSLANPRTSATNI